MTPTVIRHKKTTGGFICVISIIGNQCTDVFVQRYTCVGEVGSTVLESQESFSTEARAITYFNSMVTNHE